MSRALLIKKSKAQTKMFETIGVLVVFIIIVAIGLRFYGRIQEQTLNDAKDKFEQLDSIKMSLLLVNLPELSCSLRNDIEGSCIDLDKALVFSRFGRDKQNHYLTMFGEGYVWIEPIYPPNSFGLGNITLYNQTPRGDYETFLTPLPVTLYNGTSKKHTFAVLYVEKYNALR